MSLFFGQAVVVYDWRAGKRCKSFQGHSREITKVKAQLRFILEHKYRDASMNKCVLCTACI